MRAAIDIGTNTVLLLVGEIIDKKIRVIEEKQRIPRLGQGVDEDKKIGEDAARRVIDALLDYKEHLDTLNGSMDVIVTATSAVRDASNRKGFLDQIREETGFSVRLLSGKEEAEWTAAGARSTLHAHETLKSMIIDIGGGSTEVIRMNRNMIIDSHSYNMGSVRFTERYLKGDPPGEAEVDECRKAIRNCFSRRPFEFVRGHKGIGVAGTCTSLICILQGLQKYDPARVNGQKFTINELSSVINRFTGMTSDELLEKYPVILKGRSDIILAGFLILEGYMRHFKLREMIVSTGGIRHGSLLMTN